jgi:hypothetical protein
MMTGAHRQLDSGSGYFQWLILATVGCWSLAQTDCSLEGRPEINVNNHFKASVILIQEKTSVSIIKRCKSLIL